EQTKNKSTCYPMRIRYRHLAVSCVRPPPFVGDAAAPFDRADSYPVGESVVAAYCTLAGCWSIVAPCCRDLSGRIGVRRIAVLDEPAAGGAKVIKLKERAGIDRWP